MIQVMEDYDLTKEDWDSVIEVGQFEGQRDPVASIPSKVCTCLILNSMNSLLSECWTVWCNHLGVSGS